MASAPLAPLQTEPGRATRRRSASTGSTPGKRVIITEKPSMGRAVAAALGATTRRTGYLEGASDLVTWCVGHLVELDAPEAYNPAWKQWRLADLPLTFRTLFSGSMMVFEACSLAKRGMVL